MVKKRKIIIFIVLPLFIIITIAIFLFGRNKSEIKTIGVVRGDVVREVAETGQVSKGDEIKMGFQNSGRLKKVYVSLGQEIKNGIPLAEFDTQDLRIQLQKAQASLDVTRAKLDKLLAGPSAEEIALSKSKVASAETDLNNARQNLLDAQEKARNNLDNAYDDALNNLDSADLKIVKAYQTVNLIQSRYFYYSDQESIFVKESRTLIKNIGDEVKDYIDLARKNLKEPDIDAALLKAKNSLDVIYGRVKTIRDKCEESFYDNIVSSADKTLLDNQESSIIAIRNDVADDQQSILSLKIANRASINSAQANVSTARGNLDQAKKDMDKITAKPSENDIKLYQAQVREAQSQFSLLENQIKDSFLRSPVGGEVVKIYKKEGENVNPSEPVIGVLSDEPFQVKVDIYEEDVSKVKISDPVDIRLVAFPDKVMKGKVISIDPAEKIIDNVVYYETTIGFQNTIKGLKPGMTADISIRTDLRKNVLVLPQKALLREGKKSFVMVLDKRKEKKKEVRVGLEGNGGQVEIISGLKDGEKVVIP